MMRTDKQRIKDHDEKAKKKGKKAYADLDEKGQGKLKKEWGMERKKGQAALDAGADPSDTPQSRWFAQLRESGIEIHDDPPEEIEVGKLIASQAEIKAGKSYGIASAYLTGDFAALPDLPILVARDPKTGAVTVIDGHHRYAGLLLADPSKKMKVKVIEAPIREALEAAFDVPGVFRADLQDNIVDPDKPLDLARAPGAVWKQKNGKWYGKNQKGKTGGPYGSEDKAKTFAGGKKATLRASLVRFAHAHPEHRAKILPLLQLGKLMSRQEKILKDSVSTGGSVKKAQEFINVPGKHIFDKAEVTDNARVSGRAKVTGDAEVFDNAVVTGRALVTDNAKVWGYAKVFGYARVKDNAKVSGRAKVWGQAQVYENAWVVGRATVTGNARIGGTAVIRGGVWDGTEGNITKGTWDSPTKRIA
jgi:carbonic anhydrase/acetyltransferase-like protein (isoleucine patch superfamily)